MLVQMGQLWSVVERQELVETAGGTSEVKGVVCFILTGGTGCARSCRIIRR